MAANAIRQAPGWWPSLVRAECDRCGWTGPTRDLNNSRDSRMVKHVDQADHNCEGTA